MGTVGENVVTLTIIGMGIATYLPRLLPLLLLTRRDQTGSALPPPVETWLRHVPAAVLAAMLLPSVVVAEGRLHLGSDNLYLWAAIPTLVVAWKTRSLFGSVVLGMAVVAVGRLLFG